MKKIFTILFAIFLVNMAFSQKPNIKFGRISLEEGLSQSSVANIIQDSRGFMWFATVDGLDVYDGYDINVYWNEPNKKNTITDNIVNFMYESKDKQNPILWIGTKANGLCKFNKEQGNFKSFRANKGSNSLNCNIITSITGDNNTLWIATYRGLNELDVKTEKFKSYPRIKDKNNTISNDTINTMVEDENHNLWLGTKNGLNFFDTKTKKYKSYFISDGLIDNEINSLFFDKNNVLWIGTPNGLGILDTKTNQFFNKTQIIKQKIDIETMDITAIQGDTNDSILWIGTRSSGLIMFNKNEKDIYLYINNPAISSSLSVNSIMSIYVDRSNILWVGTSLGGVNKWNRAAEELAVFRHNPYDENSLSASQVRSIYTDKENIIWIGTVEGGLNRWDKSKNTFTHYKHEKGNSKSLSHNHVRSIFEDDDNNFWVATDGGGLNLFDKKRNTFTAYKHDDKNPKSISSNRVWKITQIKNGNILVGTFGGGINILNKEEKTFAHLEHDENNKNTISSNKVTSILEDKDGNIWVGTFGGLNKLHYGTKKFLRFQYNENDTNSLSNNRVYSLHQDTEGYLWIGTKGGLNKFDIKTGKFKRFLRGNEYSENALPNNVILGILEENEFIWVSTNNGIARINKKTSQIKNFDIGDGLQSSEFLAGSYHKSKNGELFFGGINGFNAFFPSRIKDNPHKPPIVITGFKISNQNAELDSSITVKKLVKLKHFQNDISFDFVALDFIFPEKNRYKYKLINYDNDWNKVTYRRYAKYTNLAPGEYIFKVIGSNNDNVWNDEGVSLKIYIKPAFWQTLWFKILVSLFIVLMVFAIYTIRMRNIKEQNKELERQVKMRTAEIRQQNEEIRTQRDEIAEQRDMVERQKEEITDSIHYAKRIQTAAMPSAWFLNKNIPEYFILFKPRDIVSGDFYWATRKEDKVIITAADCTGHGVPGAFMSMLGVSFLNKIVNENEVIRPDLILNKLRKEITHTLNANEDNLKIKDGMDMSLCVIDTKTNIVQFSGAYNPLFYISKGEIKTVKADRMPIALYDVMDDFKYTELQLQKGDMLYLFSDGYPDQFGGEQGKKFKTKRLRELIFSISDKSMLEQKEILDRTIEEWRGNEEQIDDIVIIGIKL